MQQVSFFRPLEIANWRAVQVYVGCDYITIKYLPVLIHDIADF
jgi:hypothetical protein